MIDQREVIVSAIGQRMDDRHIRLDEIGRANIITKRVNTGHIAAGKRRGGHALKAAARWRRCACAQGQDAKQDQDFHGRVAVRAAVLPPQSV